MIRCRSHLLVHKHGCRAREEQPKAGRMPCNSVRPVLYTTKNEQRQTIPGMYCPCSSEERHLSKPLEQSQYASEHYRCSAHGDPPPGVVYVGLKSHLCKGLRTGSRNLYRVKASSEVVVLDGIRDLRYQH